MSKSEKLLMHLDSELMDKTTANMRLAKVGL